MSKKFLFSIIIVLLVTNLTTLLFLQSKDSAKEGIDRKGTVAIVGDERIDYDDWIHELKGQYGKQQLEQMIDRAVVRQLAAEHDIQVDEKIVQRDIARRTTMAGIIPEEKYEQVVDFWQEDIIFRYQLEQLLTLDIAISEEEIAHHYEQYKNEYDFISSLQLSHIVVPDAETAEKVIRELDEGASFSLLAQEYSLDEATKEAGGYLGYLPTTSQFLPNQYEEIANNMEENTYSEPFATDEGMALIFLHRKLDSVQFAYEEIKPYIRSELALKKENLVPSAEKLWNELEIDWIYDDEK